MDETDVQIEPSQSAQAVLRRRELDADIVLGALELWIGVGANISWPWLDVAVRIGKGWGVFLDIHAPLVKRPDLVAFVKALRAFAENTRDDAFLGSLGGSMRVTLRRSEHGSLHGEAFFQHGPSSQTVSFSLWDASLQAAVAQAELALDRVLAADHLGWIPDPHFLERMPHVTDPQPPEVPRAFAAWDAGLGEGEDVTFDYEVDGYGWYAITVKVGDKTGETGGSYLTDSKGDLIRAALAMLAGSDRAEVTCRGEPGHVVLELQRVHLRSNEATEVGLPGRSYFGCWVRIRDLYDNPVGGGTLEFEALCRSPRAVAEAIYRMALAHFEGGAGFWSPAMASLEGALKTVPRQPGE